MGLVESAADSIPRLAGESVIIVYRNVSADTQRQAARGGADAEGHPRPGEP